MIRIDLGLAPRQRERWRNRLEWIAAFALAAGLVALGLWVGHVALTAGAR